MTLLGRTRSGTGTDAGAPLALLHFRAAGGDEGQEGSERPPLETLAVLAELDGPSDEELQALLARARPPDFEPGAFFAGTRRGGRDEGR